MKPTARLGRAALARSPYAWLKPRSTALYPPTCLACRAATDRHGALCPRCWSTMRFIETALLRAPRHAVRARPRPRPHLAAGDGRSAGVRPGPGGGEVRGWTGAHAGASAQIFRPRRARPADRELDGSRRGRHSGRRRSPSAGAAARLAAVATAVQPGRRADGGDFPPNRQTVRSKRRFGGSRRRAARWA